MIFEPRFPNADHIAEEPKRELGIFGGLMFEKNVDETLFSSEGSSEKQIAFAVAIVGIDERPGLNLQLLPIDPSGDREWYFPEQKGSGVDWVAEPRFEQFVMGLVERFVGHDVLCSWFLVPCSLFFVFGSKFLVLGSWLLKPEGGGRSGKRRGESSEIHGLSAVRMAWQANSSEIQMPSDFIFMRH